MGHPETGAVFSKHMVEEFILLGPGKWRKGGHQQFDMCLKCLGQTVSDMSDTSGVTDPCLKSGMFLSGSDVIVWHLSGHSLFNHPT